MTALVLFVAGVVVGVVCEKSLVVYKNKAVKAAQAAAQAMKQ